REEVAASPSSPTGLGLVGTGRGGGGSGEGTIGLGNVGTIGKGGGTGTGSGYGSGPGSPKRSRQIARSMGAKGGASSADIGKEVFEKIDEPGFITVADEALSTFSVDVDTASYALMRRFLNEGGRPPADSVRLEELVNYFDY